MAYREITDGSGRTWQVWDTNPHHSVGKSIIANGYEAGWLTFESGAEKRRLAPAPPEWDSLEGAALLQMLEGAEAVRPSPPGTPPPDGATAEVAGTPPEVPEMEGAAVRE